MAKRISNKLEARKYSDGYPEGSAKASVLLKDPPLPQKTVTKTDLPYKRENTERKVEKAAQSTKKPFVENYSLPATYNSTSLSLIARDPYWIYAYWEVSQSSINDIRNRIGEGADQSRHVLRMYDVTAIDFNGNNARNTFDIEVGPNSSNWYVNLWVDNASYCSELGLRMPDGKFYAFARSNFVTTPRSNPSQRSEQIWMEVKDSSSQAPFVVGDIQRTDVTGEKESRAAGRVKRKKKKEPAKSRRWRKILLTEADIKAYYSRLSPRLKDVISNKLAPHYENKKFGSGRVYVDIKGNKIVLEDFLVRGLSRNQFIKRLLSGASEELVFLGGASESIFSGASENARSQDKRRKFFFELWTELIVYGRTEPDAEVWMGDRKIDLRSDGTFTLRFALPDGKIPLDFAAISNDKVERREISTAVERQKTRYNP